MCDGMLACITIGRIDCHAEAVTDVASDIPYYGSAVFLKISPYKSVVFALGSFIEELQTEMSLGIGCLGYDEQSAGVLIDAVNEYNFGIIHIELRSIAEMPCKGIEKSTAPIAESGMDYQSGWLVDDQKVVVLINDVERYLLGEYLVVVVGTVEHDLNDICGLDTIGTLYGFSVNMDESCISSFLHTVTTGICHNHEQVFIYPEQGLSLIAHKPVMLIELGLFVEFGIIDEFTLGRSRLSDEFVLSCYVIKCRGSHLLLFLRRKALLLK